MTLLECLQCLKLPWQSRSVAVGRAREDAREARAVVLVRVEVAEKPKAEEAKSEIADILARRMVIAAESESDGSDSDDDWDD